MQWAAVFLAFLFPLSAHSLPSSFQTLPLEDPVLHMTAFEVAIPAGWKMEGAVAPGTACKTDPFPVFRAYSPDGLTEFRRLPRFDWASSTARSSKAGAECPQLSTKIAIGDFLRYVARLRSAESIADWPLSASDRNNFLATIQQANANYQQSGMRGYSMTGDIGAVRISIHNGTFQIEEQLLAAMICNHTPLPDGSSITGCSAQVRALRAPRGQLDALVSLISNHPGSGAIENPAWRQRLNQAIAAQNAAVMRQRDASFRQWSAIMAHDHQQFMQQMQSEGDSRNRAFEQHMQTKDTVASDWVDYALNQQTVTGSGGIAKVSSAYGYTWSNGNGQWYQTNDPNANPNGVLNGNWSKQQVVHGNGTP
jgi:hypothetical protein